MGGEILVLIIVGGIVALLLCGLIAMIRLHGVNRRLVRLEGEVSFLRAQARQAPPIPQTIPPAPEPRAGASTAPAAPTAPPELPIAPPEPRDLTLSLWPEELFRETTQAPPRASAAARESADEPEPVLSGAEKPGSAAPFEIPAETPRPASRHRGYPRSGSATPFEIPAETPPAPGTPPPIPPETPTTPPPAPSGPSLSLEQVLGTKWLAWVGMVLVLVSAAFFMKYAYDNNWIGPRGRLAIGTLASLAALVLGEHFRRKDWKALFQTLTGGGIAGFYICIFFSFQVYHLAGQEPAFGLACLVTALAVALAVVHDALPIAILGLIGGFLSPPLLSTGENHPYALFTFITILDLVALGAAYFRRWKALDILAFSGTTVMYIGWYTKFYGLADEPSQMLPALLFTSVFYLLFLLIPSLYYMVRRLPAGREGLILLAINAVVSLGSYYKILYPEHRNALGYAALGQALLVFALFRVWCRRLEQDKITAEALLVIGLALVTLAVPLRLRFYAIPLAWAAEGFLFAYLGVRFGRLLLRAAGALALILAACGLLHRLYPHSLLFHRVAFLPILNAPFGSWLAVAAASLGTAWLLYRKGADEPYRKPLAALSFLLGFALTCAALSLETAAFWKVLQPAAHPEWRYPFDTHLMTSLIVLWALISALTVRILKRAEFKTAGMPLLWVCHAIAVVIFLAGFEDYDGVTSAWLALNQVFPFRLVLILALWWAGWVLERKRSQLEGNILAITGHFLLTILLAVEIVRWCDNYKALKNWGVSLISAAWALQALALVAAGLARRNLPLRIMGFVLFGLTVGKVCLVDTSALEPVYRIVSFGASGAVLLLAGYLYQRFSARLLKEKTEEENLS